MWFRLGIAYSDTSGTPANQADIGLVASWAQMGSFLDVTTVRLEANDTGSRLIYPVTRWLPQRFATKFKFSIVGTGVTGGANLQYQLVSQTAPTSIQNPGAWSTSFDVAS